MIIIRHDQKEVLRQAALTKSADELTAALCESYPLHCRVAGKPALRNLVDAGIRRAMELGLEKRGEVQTYVELSLLLGHDFENDPQLPWVAKILDGQDEIPMVQQLEQVYAKAIDFLDQVAGVNGVNLDQALRAIEKTPVEELIPPSSPGFRDQLLQALWRVLPDKATALGTSNLKTLIRQGQKQAEALGMITHLGEGLCVWLMYLLGSGFADDPLFPWVREVLEAETPSGIRDQRLAHEAKAYLGRWLQALNGEGA